MTDEEFLDRLRKRFVEVAGPDAAGMADSVEVWEWRQHDPEDPESVADEEMECWTNDGD